MVSLDDRTTLEHRFAHGDAEILGFLRPGHDASIVVGEHDDGFAFEPGFEDAFTGRVEVVAVDEGVHRLRGALHGSWITERTTPQIETSVSGPTAMGG